MPENVRIFRVFVASPSDVEEERDTLADVIQEMNKTVDPQKSFRIELVRWETDVYPGVGTDSIQEVIDRQIDMRYDIFVGILSTRFGTPVGKYESGTESEFNDALIKFRSDPQNLQILMYFRRGPIRVAEIDTSQLAKVNAFRERLSSEKVIWKDYETIDEFESFCRIHLFQVLNDFGTKWGLPSLESPVSSISTVSTEAEGDDEEIGFIEVLEQQLDANQKVVDTIVAIGEDLNGLTETMEANTQKIDELVKNGPKNTEFARKAKELIDNVAARMERLTSVLNDKVPVYSQNYDIWLNSVATGVQLSSTFGEGEKQREEVITGIDKFLENLSTGKTSISNYMSMIRRLPKMTTRLNRAKRRLLIELGAFEKEMEKSIHTAQSVRNSLSAM